jgi:hypothetical protein
MRYIVDRHEDEVWVEVDALEAPSPAEAVGMAAFSPGYYGARPEDAPDAERDLYVVTKVREDLRWRVVPVDGVRS